MRGGAIQTWGGVILILGSTFAYNSADIVPTKTRHAGGGAIELYAADQDFPRGDILNSTFIGNSARQGGGAIDNSGAVTVTNSTFTGNVAELQGGAIRNLEGATGTVTLRYTILVNNVVSDTQTSSVGSAVADPEIYKSEGCYGAITDDGGNVQWPEDDNSCYGFHSDPEVGKPEGDGA